MSRVEKPALLRRLFQLACDYSGQILSYQKMVGQLQDVGNTTTLAHYLDLLSSAVVITGLQKYSPKSHIKRSSSPKLLALNTALLTASSDHTLESARKDPVFWGRLVETAVGAHLVNTLLGTKGEVFYWRERGKEVDYVLRQGNKLVAIEVKSGGKKGSLSGIAEFAKNFKPQKKLLVGAGGISIEDFLLKPARTWLE